MWLLNSERNSSKWATLLAVVLALGSGEAAAQLTPDNTFDGNGLKVDVASRVAEGTSVTITVTLKASVAAGTATTTPVTVTVDTEQKGQNNATNEDTDVVLNPGTATLDFPANTTSNAVTHEVRGTIPLQTIHDPDAEDETIVLAISASGGGFSITAGDQSGQELWKTVTLDDDETQSYDVALAAGAAPREGAPFDVVVRAAPAHVDDSKTLTLQLDDTDYSLATTPDDQIEGTLTADTPSFTAVVTPPANDGNRVADTVTVTAYSGTVGNATREASASFTVADAHALPAPAAVTVEARDATGAVVTSVPEGGAVELTVSVDRGRGNTAATGEALSVALSLDLGDPDQAPTYRLAPDHVDLPAVTSPDGKQSAATVVRLEARVDEFVNDDRLTLDLVTTGEADYGAGSVDSSFEIEVQDTTVKQIAPRPDSAVEQAFDAAQATAAGADGLNPGEGFSVAVSDLFEGLAPGSTVDYSATSSDPSVEVSASSTTVTVTAVSAGSAAVRVSARVRADAAAAVPQTLANEAAVEHTVTVADLPLQVTLTADPSASVEEGGEITLTAAANRAVLAGEDATVRLTFVGPVVDPAPSSVTIAVGETSGTAVVTVVDDDEVKDLGDVVVVATGGSLATDPTRLDVAVTEDDVATVHTYTFTAAAARVTEGDEIQLAVTAEPAVTQETVVSLTASPRSLADDFTLDPPAITIAAGGTSGTTVLRATDDDIVEDTEVLTLTATDPGKVLIGSVEIELVDNDTVTYALPELADTNLVEGESYALRVTADATASRDATFTVRLDPAASEADDDDFTLLPSPIVIAAGATEGMAMLTVADDGLDEGSEALVLIVTAAGGDEVGTLELTLWDASVPMLPLVPQLLLAVVLAIGGYRRFRRRQAAAAFRW